MIRGLASLEGDRVLVIGTSGVSCTHRTAWLAELDGSGRVAQIRDLTRDGSDIVPADLAYIEGQIFLLYDAKAANGSETWLERLDE
jgi:hypothetical protein